MNEEYVFQVLDCIVNNEPAPFTEIRDSGLGLSGKANLLYETLEFLEQRTVLEFDESKQTYTLSSQGKDYYLNLKNKFDKRKIKEDLEFEKLQDEVWHIKNMVSDYPLMKKLTWASIIIAFLSFLSTVVSWIR